MDNSSYKKIIEAMVKNQRLRIATVRDSHFWFYHFYFWNPHTSYPTAPFQQKLMTMVEKEDLTNLVVISFRESAKSSILTYSYPIWAITGKLQKKFILIVSQTQDQARNHLKNIKRELESNKWLRKDLGPFETENDEWGAFALVFANGAKIMAVSMGQKIRGYIHGQYRPDAIILDDIEDSSSVKTKEGRDKTFNWVAEEILPGASSKAIRIFVGNLLSKDSVLMRIGNLIIEDKIDGELVKVPLIKDDIIAWPGKFPTMDDILKLRRTVLTETAWQKEFLLNPIESENQLIREEWIHYYDKLPEKNGTNYRYTWTAVDLAIANHARSHFTAMVSAQIHGYGDDMRIYLLPYPIHRKIEFPEQIETIKNLSKILGQGVLSRVFVEGFGFQQSVPQQLRYLGFPVESVTFPGDKKEKIALTSYLVQTGKVLFPRKGAEDLINELVNFGFEECNDLADAYAILVHKAVENNIKRFIPEILSF